MSGSLIRTIAAFVLAATVAGCSQPEPPIVETPPPTPTLPPLFTPAATESPTPAPSVTPSATEAPVPSEEPTPAAAPLPAAVEPLLGLGYACEAGDLVTCTADLGGIAATATISLAGDAVDDVSLALDGPGALAASPQLFGDVVAALITATDLRDSFIGYIGDMAGRGATATLPGGVSIRLNGGPGAAPADDAASLELVDLAKFGR